MLLVTGTPISTRSWVPAVAPHVFGPVAASVIRSLVFQLSVATPQKRRDAEKRSRTRCLCVWLDMGRFKNETEEVYKKLWFRDGVASEFLDQCWEIHRRLGECCRQAGARKYAGGKTQNTSS